ncbi:transglutaminase family protein [Ramlibacter albus]|uniref:Protein SirB1 N-terminal domain-containing protein n=1 Tax=Ramlibacter albus TaxID=2079448 RepID=A0A923MEH5_9BURK|nr:transglutaminase family protein [Ramlibacter albus]MBC5768550.1 hypothetical protein [Ramlibacter albus]
MRRRTALAGILSLGAPLFAGPSAIAGSSPNRADRAAPFPSAVRAILDLPEDRIDVGLAALTFASVVHPRMDIAAYSARIDQIVRDARTHMQRKPSRNYIDILMALNSYLFDVWGMHYDHSKDARGVQANYFLNGTLDTKKGMCITMPMLYLAVAQRLGLPIAPATAPQHTFLRYMRFMAPPHNIEVTSGGGVITDEGYIKKFSIPMRGVESGAYLRTLKLREYLGVIMIQTALVLHPAGHRREALAYFEKARELDARDVVPLMYLGQYWRQEAHDAYVSGSADLAEAYYQRGLAFQRQAKNLGFALNPLASLPSGGP